MRTLDGVSIRFDSSKVKVVEEDICKVLDMNFMAITLDTGHHGPLQCDPDLCSEVNPLGDLINRVGGHTFVTRDWIRKAPG